MAEKFELGQRVNVKAEVIPEKDRNRNRIWRRYKRECTGVIAGVRTVKEGYTKCYYDEGYIFVQTHHIKVYLVAINMRTIIRVLPEDIEVAE